MRMRWSLPLLALMVSPAPGQEARKEIVLDAADLAPALSAPEPKAGKWWLKRDARDWGARGGNILLTGNNSPKGVEAREWQVPPVERYIDYRVPEIVVDPKVRGWYRIYIGLYNDPVDPYARLFGKISDQPYHEFLQVADTVKAKTAEVVWRVADLTGKKIHLAPAPGPMPHPGTAYMGGVTHLRLVPMSDAEVKAARHEIELPPQDKRLFGMLDYTDEVFWWGTLESEDDVRAVVYRHREAGFGLIYWRSWGSHLDNSLSIPAAAPRWTEKDDKAWRERQKTKLGWFPYFELTRKYDPLKVAVDYGAKNGCEVHAWVRFTNLNRPPFANFWHDNQDKLAQMVAKTKNPKTGVLEPAKPYKYSRYSRVLSMAYPEVRTFYVSFFKQLASTGTKGILIDLLRHPPICGYEPIVSEAFKKKHGKDMETLDIYRDPLVNEFTSQYLRLFLEELRKEIGNDIEIAIRTSGPNGFSTRGKEWIEAGLIDTIIDGNWYSGNGIRPTIDATIDAVGKKGKAYAIAEVYNVDPMKSFMRIPGTMSPEAITAMNEVYRNKGVRFGLYESTMYTWWPEHRKAIRLAGWK